MYLSVRLDKSLLPGFPGEAASLLSLLRKDQILIHRIQIADINGRKLLLQDFLRGILLIFHFRVSPFPVLSHFSCLSSKSSYFPITVFLTTNTVSFMFLTLSHIWHHYMISRVALQFPNSASSPAAVTYSDFPSCFSLLFSFGMSTIGVTISGHMSWPQPI